MPIRVARAFSRIHWPQAAVLIAFMASVVAALAFTPQALIEKALEADWRAIGAVITGILTALGGIVGSSLLKPSDRESDPPPRARWDEPGYHDEDPTPAMTPRAIERRDRAPGDSTRPRAKRDGSASPTTLAGILTLVLVAIAVVALSGCGASAVRIHATSATIATHAASAARAELLRAVDARIAECRALPDPVPCLDEAQRQATDAGVALDSAVVAIASYRELIEVAHLAEDQEVAGVVLSRAKAHASEQWSRVLVLATALGAHLPTSPDGGVR